jgi:putative membrane protein insertion efficiency factor
MRYVLVFLITLYQKLFSSWLPPACRFTPTCSQYAKDAVLKHGFLRGTGLALKRLSRCHPFHEGGYDPVP